MGLTFSPQPPLSGSRKRGRAAADVDGEHSCMQKKKRRLRLILITSRLSPQFSYPASNIVDRGSSKIAVWAKHKGLGQGMLRKAAILNRIRHDAASVKKLERENGCTLIKQAREQRHVEMAKLNLTCGSMETRTKPTISQTKPVPPLAAARVGTHIIVPGSPTGSPPTSPPSSRSPSPTPSSPPLLPSVEEDHSDCRSPNEAYAYSLPGAQVPRKYYTPPPPSPLGLSNYDALDSEDEIPDPYSHLDDEEESSVYMYGNGRHDSPFATDSQPAGREDVTECEQTLENDTITSLDIAESDQDDWNDVDDAETIWPSTFTKPFKSADTTPSNDDLPTVFTPPKHNITTSPTLQPSYATVPKSPNFISMGPVAASPNFAQFTY